MNINKQITHQEPVNTNSTDSFAKSDSLKKNCTDKQRSQFLLTINNPAEYSYTHDTIHEILRTKFKNLLFYCFADDVAPSTGTPHTHIYIFLSAKKRTSAVRKAFPHAHIESEVRGTPTQIISYIKKDSSNLSDEKKNSLVKGSYEEYGSIPVVLPNYNKNDILLQIQSLIEKDYRPEEIMSLSILYRQYETLIRKSFFARRNASTPPERDVKCIWHVGASGSGKSHVYVQLCKEHGMDDVFYASDYNPPRCASLFDGYEAEAYVLMDELKVGCMPYDLLLQLLQGYKAQLHCRYSNAYALYKEIHVTSVYTPLEIYQGMVAIENRNVDSLYQLMRRINTIVYHYKNARGEYCKYEIPASEFTSYEELKQRAETGTVSEFIPLHTPSPFDEVK